MDREREKPGHSVTNVSFSNLTPRQHLCLLFALCGRGRGGLGRKHRRCGGRRARAARLRRVGGGGRWVPPCQGNVGSRLTEEAEPRFDMYTIGSSPHKTEKTFMLYCLLKRSATSPYFLCLHAYRYYLYISLSYHGVGEHDSTRVDERRKG